MEEDLVDGNDLDGVYGWFGQKVMWGRMEATKLYKVFYILT